MEKHAKDLQKLLQSKSSLKKAASKRDSDSWKETYLTWSEQSAESQYELICSEIEHNWGFPTAPIFQLLKHKSRLEFELEKYQDSSLTTLQSQALGFRHQALNQYCKRLLQDENDELASMHQSILEFQTGSKSNSQVMQLIRGLPKDWRVVQLTVDDSHGHARFKNTPADTALGKNLTLKLVAVECGDLNSDDVVTIHHIRPLPDEDEMPSIQVELQSILSVHLLMYKNDRDKKEYKRIRTEVDDRMTSLTNVMENKWLNFHKVLLLGKRTENSDLISELCAKVEEKFWPKKADREAFRVCGKRKLLRQILDGQEFLSAEQTKKGLRHILDDERFGQFVLEQVLPQVQPVKAGRKPTVLILDKEIQCLPWESMPCLANHPLSRIPSLHTLSLLYQTHVKNGNSIPKKGEVNSNKIFYVLNPDQNLARTQERLEPTFTEMSLGAGIVGEQPSLPQMQKVLSEMDAYMYCGHGSTLKKFPPQEIEKLNIRALPLLFGCNSGRLQRLGRLLDPIGIIHYYLIAQAPCILGFLWSITDKDVDQWTVDFLKHWLSKDDEQTEFVQAVADKRSNFERMINRAAIVIYGLPSIKFLD